MKLFGQKFIFRNCLWLRKWGEPCTRSFRCCGCGMNWWTCVNSGSCSISTFIKRNRRRQSDKSWSYIHCGAFEVDKPFDLYWSCTCTSGFGRMLFSSPPKYSCSSPTKGRSGTMLHLTLKNISSIHSCDTERFSWSLVTTIKLLHSASFKSC